MMLSRLEVFLTAPFEGSSFSDSRIPVAVIFVAKPEIIGNILRRATAVREP